jgi:aerobic-type carbon monoxide dehydrogenase small subunit (CoxS/CutS family)
MTLRERAGKLADAFFESADDEAYIGNIEGIEAELNAVRNAALEEAKNATCSYCADGTWKSATGPHGEPAHIHAGKIVFCKAAAIRALKGTE